MSNSIQPFILIAEDDPNDVLIMKHVFHKAALHLRCEFVHDGSLAIAWLAGEGPYADRTTFPLPTLIVTDLKMSEQGGFAVLRFVKSHPKLKHIPVIVHSSSNLGTDIQKSRDLGAVEYIVKEALFGALVNTLTAYERSNIASIRAA